MGEVEDFHFRQPWNFNQICTRMLDWRRKWQPTPVFLPGKSHGLRMLVGNSPWGRKESHTTKQLHFTQTTRYCAQITNAVGFLFSLFFLCFILDSFYYFVFKNNDLFFYTIKPAISWKLHKPEDMGVTYLSDYLKETVNLKFTTQRKYFFK